MTTDYTLPNGYQSYLGAALAVRIAPFVLGGIPTRLIADEKRLGSSLNTYQPAIVNVDSFTCSGARAGGLSRFNAGF